MHNRRSPAPARADGQSVAGASTRAVAIAATPSPRPVSPSPSVVVADTDTGAPTAAESAASASARRGPSRGRLPITWTATLPISKPGVAHPACGLVEEGGAGRARPRGVRRTEVAAQVAEARRGQQRVAGGVGGDVGVGVALQALRLVGPVQSGEVEGCAVDETVHVGADADPWGTWGL